MLLTQWRSAVVTASLATGFFCFAVKPSQGSAANAVPAPSYAITEPDWPLWQLPSREAQRRGSLLRDTGFTLFSMLAGAGCKSPWWQVGAFAWLCPDGATLSPVQWSSTSTAKLPGTDVHGYVMVKKGGALGYARRESVDVGSPDAEMQPGFTLGFTNMVDSNDGSVLQTTHGLWVPARDVTLLRPSEFHGVEVDGELDVAWVIEKRASVYSAPDVKQMPPRFVERLSAINVQGQQQRPSGLWIKYEGGWLKSTGLRLVQLQPPPEQVSSDEHWIDVDTNTQTLIAYIGSRPVYATLVSTGRGKTGTPQATPPGTYRIWVKLGQTDMDNLDEPAQKSPYAVEAVPHVMFFTGGYGIHGTYWHDEFGTPKSHGCVNVSLRDARWLFLFASPHLPVGWSAVFPTALERGTLVRVR